MLGTKARAGQGRGPRSLDQVERKHIRAVLAESDGNRTRAAAVLGISPATLWRRLRTMKASGARHSPRPGVRRPDLPAFVRCLYLYTSRRWPILITKTTSRRSSMVYRMR
ncbi:MAG TPA: helix-turn-helix domain-containing protein [Polyangia bacterium]|nr:helix-turn-helix domain-containing protein [Polyangia bacterium]